MAEEFSYGQGDTRIILSIQYFGSSLLATISNKNAHVGAVAVGEYSPQHDRTSVSVITRLAHKEDEIARQAAYTISRHTKQASCVIVGIHIDNISMTQMVEVEKNCHDVLAQFTASVSPDT